MRWICLPDDPPRLTEFCTEMIQVSINAVGTGLADLNTEVSWTTRQCEVHNCYDRDCADYAERVKQARGE